MTIDCLKQYSVGNGDNSFAILHLCQLRWYLLVAKGELTRA